MIPALDPTFFLTELANAVIIGVIYALMALGLTLIFGIMKIVNFAHGEVYMVGGYAYYVATSLMSINVYVSLGLAIAVAAAVGFAIEHFFISPSYTGRVEKKDEYTILVTFGLSIFIMNSVLVVFGPWPRRPPSYAPGLFEIGTITVSLDRIVVTFIGVGLLAAITALLYFTKVGKALRAVSQDREAALVVGINVNRMNALTFTLGCALAGAGGALTSPIFLTYPDMGTFPGIKGFVIIVLGGMGSVPGAIIGSILLGLVEVFTSAYIPDPRRAFAYRDIYGLIILVLVLLLRPSGLLGEKGRKA